MCNHLEAAFAGKISRLLINLPPECLKSSLISVVFPAWVWSLDPKKGFLTISYDVGIANRDATDSRALMESDWYQVLWPEVRFRKDQNAKSDFRNTAGGFRITTTGTRATGEHPDFFIWDDPLHAKNWNDRKKKDDCRDFYTNTMATRGRSKARTRCHILAQQRLAVDDPSSIFTKMNETAEQEGEPHPVVHVRLPMRYESNLAMKDYGYGKDWRTEEGQLIDPQRLDDSTVTDMERTLRINARAQLQQDPAKVASTVLRMERMQFLAPESVPSCDLYVRFWDKAATEDGGCRTAGVLLGIKAMGNDTFNYFFIHCHKGQWSTDDVESHIQKTAVADQLKYGEKYIVGLEREPGSGGKYSVNATKKRLRNFRVIDVPPTTNKIARAAPLATALSFDEAYCVEAAFTADFVDELTEAPNSRYMDQFDAANGAVALANEEVAKVKKKVIMAGLETDPCSSPGCDRPKQQGRDYCCDKCEGAAAFDDPEMIATVDHTHSCNARTKSRDRGIA